MKYRLKGTFELKPYTRGMEDGYQSFDISGRYLGYFSKNEPIPKACNFPIIVEGLGRYHRVTERDYILTNVETGQRTVIRAEDYEYFLNTHEPVEE